MKALLGSILLATMAISSAPAKSRHCMLRVHVEGNAQDGATFSQAVKAQISGKPVAIEGIPRISEQDVVAFKPYQNADGTFGALIQLDENGRIQLDTLSVERHGRYAFIFVNGRAVTEVMIDKRISDGKLYIHSGLTAADIVLMKKDWKMMKPAKAKEKKTEEPR